MESTGSRTDRGDDIMMIRALVYLLLVVIMMVTVMYAEDPMHLCIIGP